MLEDHVINYFYYYFIIHSSSSCSSTSNHMVCILIHLSKLGNSTMQPVFVLVQK